MTFHFFTQLLTSLSLSDAMKQAINQDGLTLFVFFFFYSDMISTSHFHVINTTPAHLHIKHFCFTNICRRLKEFCMYCCKFAKNKPNFYVYIFLPKKNFFVWRRRASEMWSESSKVSDRTDLCLVSWLTFFLLQLRVHFTHSTRQQSSSNPATANAQGLIGAYTNSFRGKTLFHSSYLFIFTWLHNAKCNRKIYKCRKIVDNFFFLGIHMTAFCV